MMIKHTVRVNFVTLFVTVLSVVTVTFLSNLSSDTRATGPVGRYGCTVAALWLELALK